MNIRMGGWIDTLGEIMGFCLQFNPFSIILRFNNLGLFQLTRVTTQTENTLISRKKTETRAFIDS